MAGSFLLFIYTSMLLDVCIQKNRPKYLNFHSKIFNYKSLNYIVCYFQVVGKMVLPRHLGADYMVPSWPG